MLFCSETKMIEQRLLTFYENAILFLQKYHNTRKYPLRGYFLGVLTHTTAWDRLWRGDETERLVLKVSSAVAV